MEKENRKIKNCAYCGKAIRKLKTTVDWDVRTMHKTCHRNVSNLISIYPSESDEYKELIKMLDYKNFI